MLLQFFPVCTLFSNLSSNVHKSKNFGSPWRRWPVTFLVIGDAPKFLGKHRFPYPTPPPPPTAGVPSHWNPLYTTLWKSSQPIASIKAKTQYVENQELHLLHEWPRPWYRRTAGQRRFRFDISFNKILFWQFFPRRKSFDLHHRCTNNAIIRNLSKVPSTARSLPEGLNPFWPPRIVSWFFLGNLCVKVSILVCRNRLLLSVRNFQKKQDFWGSSQLYFYYRNSSVTVRTNCYWSRKGLSKVSAVTLLDVGGRRHSRYPQSPWQKRSWGRKERGH